MSSDAADPANESARSNNKQLALTAEQREVAKEQREVAKEQRVVAEEQREVAEEQRGVAEEQRVVAEKSRLTDERLRRSAETTRDGAEQLRRNAEHARQTAEETRERGASASRAREERAATAEALGRTNRAERHIRENSGPGLLGNRKTRASPSLARSRRVLHKYVVSWLQPDRGPLELRLAACRLRQTIMHLPLTAAVFGLAGLPPRRSREARRELTRPEATLPVSLSRIRRWWRSPLACACRWLKDQLISESMFASASPWHCSTRSISEADPFRPAGYAFEQRQRAGQAWLGQPLIQVDLLATGHAIGAAVGKVRRARAEHAAREEVQRALTEFCATHNWPLGC
jgi:hypothetical protein